MNPYEPIFKEIATGLLEKNGIKPNYSDDALLDATQVLAKLF